MKTHLPSEALRAALLPGLLALSCLGAAPSQAAVDIPDVPLSVRQTVKPLVMLVAGKDHRLFYEAYNDASDLDGDGALDIRFKPALTYLGLFNPDLCYRHNDKSDNTGLFSPSGRATGAARTCSAAWSGNWLNYVTTSRIDAIRVVLYGGMREVDTADSTVLRRAYIPQDGHSWAKEYTSPAADGYDISRYTPFAVPAADKRHFFGNLTANAEVDCAKLSNCSDLAPWLSVVTHSSKRVWEWASTSRPVLSNSTHGGTRSNYTVRVAACSSGYTDGCKAYGSRHKPVGLLHDYGETEAMLFGLLSGSYDRSLSGGRLRKVVSSFKDEVNPDTGQFTATRGIVRSFDTLRIRDFNNGSRLSTYRGGWLGNRLPKDGDFPDWGNPIGEMMYEALRYFAGKGSPTQAFMGAQTQDDAVGLPGATWDDPYAANSKAKAPICARANLLVVSDANVSYDSDQVPGAYSGFAAPGLAGDLPAFNAASAADAITAGEPAVKGARFIGESGSSADSTPAPKAVTSLATVRGLAPEEPTKQGSYYAAAAAYFGSQADLRADKSGRQGADTFAVVMASPLPRIVVPVAGGRQITLVPFAKSIGGAYDTVNTKGAFQPTNQIVDFFVEQIANSSAADGDPRVNEGRYYARFRITYEDVEQGADHEMDVIAEYTLQANADGSVTVTVRPTYEASRMQHRIGYVISGTQADGVYLEVQHADDTVPYFLNTPPGRLPGYCDTATVPDDCKRLPYLGAIPPGDTASRSFRPGAGVAAGWLKDPLWYAAKWGGFTDRNGSGTPDLAAEWDTNGDGVPDNYVMVQDPTKLRQSLKRTLDNIAARVSSVSSVAVNATSVAVNTLLYQAVFNPQRWSGDLVAWRTTDTGLDPMPAWRAADQLADWRNRKVFIQGASGNTVRLSSYDQLAASDQGLLGSQEVMDYLRGRRDQELQNGGSLRDRDSPLGDIVHSAPFHDREDDTLYVAANDGMLHAIRASDGAELFAYAPRASVARLANLASPAYAHKYLLDGEVVVSPRSAATGQKAFLYALLGRGGKGLFSLDVTRPAQFGVTRALWEYTPDGSSVAAQDADLGLMLGRPQVVTLQGGKLGVIVGNGYNSSSEKAVLYVFIINSSGSLAQVRKIDTGAAGNNGLAAPAVVDSDNDGKADLVYAGDLKGNVWKFDISAENPGSWGLAFSGSALFQARDAQGNTQPITARVFVARNDRSRDPHFGKLFVFFGTGSYFKEGDAASTGVQSWYGLIDEGTASIGNSRGLLRRRSISQTRRDADRAYRTFAPASPGDMEGRKGWYLDLGNPMAGERIVTGSRLVNVSVPALIASSMYPITNTPCVPGGSGYLNLIDPYTGGALELGVMDTNGNGDFSDDRIGSNFIGSIDLAVGIPGESTVLSALRGTNRAYVPGTDRADNGSSSLTLRGPAPFRRRISWREIVRD